MKNFDYYKMVIEMLDKLYEHEGFQEWYDSLDISVEDQIEKDLVEIAKRRVKLMSEEKNFDDIYNEIIEDLRGNLTNEEYRELITLEYVLTQGYGKPGYEERFKELRNKKR